MNTVAGLLIGLFILGTSVVLVVRGWAEADSARITIGERIYAEKGCMLCHAIKGKGGKTGPDLTEIGAKRDAQWLKRFMTDPKAIIPTAKMVPFTGSPGELDALVAYLSSLR